MKHIFIIYWLLLAYASHASAYDDLPRVRKAWYLVSFSDKAACGFYLDKPKAFLSQRALDRRTRYGILVDSLDLPVSPAYLDSLRTKSAIVLHSSRWLNAATILLPKDSLSTVESFPFVDSVRFVGPWREMKSRREVTGTGKLGITEKPIKDPLGYSGETIRMMRGDTLFKLGFLGRGMRVAVLDEGFDYLYRHAVFDSLLPGSNLLATRDFLNGDTIVSNGGDHGSKVLSLLAANNPGLLMGTAREAGYDLLKTENRQGEYPLEECHWVAAIEYADSSGVDVITASLSYKRFSKSSLNYGKDGFDGNTALSSRAAGIGRRKGMLVVVSAGNGGTGWNPKVGAPADSPGALAVGAVDADGSRAGFSSVGPSSDGRIKPDLMAPGKSIVLPDFEKGSLGRGNGTSFAAPILAGLATCLWQAFPECSATELIDALKNTASNASDPDMKMGYGIPDFAAAFRYLEVKKKSGK